MTIAVTIKVNDGVVLASDSASSIIVKDSSGKVSVVYIYEHANKIFNLYKGLSIGAITWGTGSIGVNSISTLAKDFRVLLGGHDEPWCIDRESYTIEDVANKLRKFMFEKHYVAAFEDWKDEEKPGLGFIVAGYSAGESMAEEWHIEIGNGKCLPPKLLREKKVTGISWSGEPEVITRLYYGVAVRMPAVLKELGFEEDKIPHTIERMNQMLKIPMIVPAMPIQDTIDLSVFLVDTTIRFSRFRPGAPTVGGPIEVAAITKHEGFKWVRRKHYYQVALNPEGRSEKND